MDFFACDQAYFEIWLVIAVDFVDYVGYSSPGESARVIACVLDCAVFLLVCFGWFLFKSGAMAGEHVLVEFDEV